MKPIFLILFLFLLFFIGCEKENIKELPADNITYSAINKTITLSQPDTIEGVGAHDLVFEINETDESVYTATVREINENYFGDVFNRILTNRGSGNVLPLSENLKLYEESNWDGIGYNSGRCLDEFAGRGEKYIGYCRGFFPSGIINYKYGWIKIELSADKSTMTIIDRAVNHTENKNIKTGQVE